MNFHLSIPFWLFKIITDSVQARLTVANQEFNSQLEAEKKYSRDLGNWIKTNLGTNLELLNTLINTKVGTELKNQEEEAKKREEALWMVFGKLDIVYICL